MTDAVDPVTSALTGALPFILLFAALLTWPIAMGLLSLYTRAVRRSMRSSASRSAPPIAQPAAATNGPLEHSSEAAERGTLYDLPANASGSEAGVILLHLMARPRRAAFVYAVGGAAYGLVMTTAEMLADGMEFLPIRFSILFWQSVWPVVLTVGIVAAATRLVRIGLATAYFVVLFGIAAIVLPSSPDATWRQLIQSWAISELPPTVLVLMCLSRRVRAVGPLVLTFLFLGLVGSVIAVAVAGSDDRYLRAAITIADVVGLGAVSTLVSMLVLGFLIFAVGGWIVLAMIRRQYQAKQISDESVTIDAIWILFAIYDSVNLVFGHPLWALAGIVAFAAYKVCVRVGLRWVGRDHENAGKSPVLLVLRSFSIGKDGERLFDVIDRFWRRVGSIQMIAGVDLARRTVEPHEFLDFVSGKLARRFIDGPKALDQRMRERDIRPDRDLRFRVNDFFCYDDTWKLVLSRLASDTDAVLMDLRGFSRQNAGCVFELRELARTVPLERVVFVVDRRTDEKLLAETLGERRGGVYRLDALTGRHVRGLMRSLAAAAAPPGTAAARLETAAAPTRLTC